MALKGNQKENRQFGASAERDMPGGSPFNLLLLRECRNEPRGRLKRKTKGHFPHLPIAPARLINPCFLMPTMKSNPFKTNPGFIFKKKLAASQFAARLRPLRLRLTEPAPSLAGAPPETSPRRCRRAPWAACRSWHTRRRWRRSGPLASLPACRWKLTESRAPNLLFSALSP